MSLLIYIAQHILCWAQCTE